MPSRTEKFRGSKTHGRGKKAGRGAGLRGGRGNAGLHKHKRMYQLKYMPDHWGRHGFKRPQCLSVSKFTINISMVEQNIESMLEDKMAKEDGGLIEIDLSKMGVDKLLGKGRVTNKMRILVPEASKKAVEKIVDAGGEVITNDNIPQAADGM